MILYVECFADEALVRTLGIPRRAVRHMFGKGKITNQLSQLEAGTGLVDEDTTGIQPRELLNYRRVNQTGKLVLMEHADSSKKRLVLICPRLEEWLYERATACGVNPSDYGLPDSPNRLHSISRYEKKPKFIEFLKRLLELDSEMQCLKGWIA